MTIKMYEYGSYHPKPLADLARQARLAEEIGFDSVWVMDHVFIQRSAGRVLAHDPMIALAAAAAATRRILIGTLVLSHAFRHVVQVAREAAALADLAEARLVLGLGTGWHRPEFDAIGLPYDHRIARLEEALPALKGLLTGNEVTLGGEWLQLRGASVAVTTQSPPIWIAAEKPRMLTLAAQADGWNHAHWGAEDNSRFATALSGLRAAIDRAGRDRDEVETSACIACVIDDWQRIPGGFQEPEVAVGAPTRLAEIVRSYAAAGAENVILSLSPDPFAEVDPNALEKAAAILRQV